MLTEALSLSPLQYLVPGVQFLLTHVRPLPIQSSSMLHHNFTIKGPSCTTFRRLCLGRTVLLLPPQTPPINTSVVSFSALPPTRRRRLVPGNPVL
jgi:hypothetical protein